MAKTTISTSTALADVATHLFQIKDQISLNDIDREYLENGLLFCFETSIDVDKQPRVIQEVIKTMLDYLENTSLPISPEYVRGWVNCVRDMILMSKSY